MLTPQYMANALVRSSSNIVKQEPIKSKKWRIWECLSDSNTSGLEEKIRVLGVEPMTFRITSPDAVPLSYRRLVGGKATKLWVYVTNQWRIQTFRWGRGGGGGVSKNFFSELQASVWSKNKGGGAGPGPSSLSPRSATTNVLHTARTGMSLQYARCVSRSLFLKFGIWRAREKPRPVVRDK